MPAFHLETVGRKESYGANAAKLERIRLGHAVEPRKEGDDSVNYFMKHSQKAAAVFLAFVMCLSLLPTAAFAAGDSRDTVSAPTKLDTAVLYEQLREDEEESVSVTAAQLFDLPNAGLEEQDGEEHYPAQLILNEGQEDERILTPEDLEDLAEAEQPTFRISENEIVLLSPDGGEEQIVTLSAAFDGWDEALPAQVQAFLDAVAEIPEEITADNAEEIAEYVYGPVSEAYEALLGTEYAEREDVKAAEAIYSQAVADVDAALDMENSSYATEHPAQDIAVRPNLTLRDVTYGNNVKNGKLDTYAGKVTKYVGDNGYYLRCPSYQPLCNVSFKNSWGQIVYTCRYSYGLWAAKDYIDINVTSIVPGLIDDIKYSIGTNPYSQLYGSECLRLDYTAIKPGQTEVQQSYYVNFEVKKVSGSYCPNSFKYTPAGQMLPQHTSDFSEGYYWWKYKDAFDVTVKARYQLNYDSQGGSPVNLTYNDVAATTATLKVTNATPTREGYTFKGWAETADAKTAQYTDGEPISLTWSEGYGSTSNPVSKTLYAVWEKTDTKTYTVIYTDGTDGVVFGDESHGNLKVGDDTPNFLGKTDREGYTFMGWAPAVNPKVSADDATDDKIIYTATWKKNAHQTAEYTVQWLDTANTLLKSESRNGTVGTTVNVASSDKSYAGYTYAGDRHSGSVLSATLAKSDTILKMYFIKNTTPPVNPKLEKLEKERLTAEPADVTLNLDGVTVNYNKNVVFVGNDAPAVTLLYKITVTGTAGAQYKVTDADATHVGGDPLIGAIAEGKTQAVIYVTKTFTKDNVVNGQLTNNATLESNGTSENPTDGPEGDNGKGGSSSDAKKQYNVTINFKTDGGTELQKPSKTTVDEGDDFAYTRESTSFMAPVRNAVTNAIVIPERLGENGKYVLDEVASAEGLAKLAAAKNITADVVADIIYSLDTKGTIGTDDAGNPTDTSDGIPDKYQAKVTFKVENGTWNNEETADVVVYVEKYAADGETYAADGTATLADAEIPSAGEKPNANFKAGSWDDTPTKETQVSGDTVYTYTYAEKGTFTVTFDSNGGSAVTSQNVPEGGKVTKPADPTREGYTFNGWNLGDQAYDFSTPVTGDITLTAQWTANQVPPTPKKVTVSWLPGYGDNQPIKTETIDQGTDYAGLYPANPSRSGYTFTGWSDPVTGSDGNITITAQWRQNSGGGGGGGSSRPTPRPDPNPSTQIEDPDVPLAGAPGLNTTDHYAYVTGYPDGTVRPQANITRAEVATIFFRLMTDEYRSTNWSSTNGFPDVANASLWYNNAVSTAAKAGLLKGKEDGKFYPTANITRAEFATIAARFTSDEEVTAKPFPDTVGHWAEQDIIRAVQAGWIKGNSDGTFRPNDPITRAEAMTLVNRMLDRVPDKDHMLSDMVTWPDNPVSAWFYEAVQEATNSHDYERDEMGVTETWTGKLPDRDWSALEKEWSNAASSVGNDVAGDLEKK